MNDKIEEMVNKVIDYILRHAENGEDVILTAIFTYAGIAKGYDIDKSDAISYVDRIWNIANVDVTMEDENEES